MRTYRDLAQLGSMDAVGGSGDVPVVEQNSSALVRRDSYVNLHQIKVKVKQEQKWASNNGWRRGHDYKVGWVVTGSFKRSTVSRKSHNLSQTSRFQKRL